MLLEFRVSNFRSIRDEAVLSLVATSGDKELRSSHLQPTKLKASPYAVRSAVIYGPNASGKSTLLLALNYMRAVVAESATVVQPGHTYNFQPFKLDSSYIKKPAAFEMSFLHEGTRYQYGFEMTPERIVSESLVVYRSIRPTQLFSRQLNSADGNYDYEFSNYLTGPRKIWQESTRSNALFLSTAAQLNSEILSPIFKWIVNSIVYLPAGSYVNHESTTAMLTNELGRREIREFLSTADISIQNVEAVARKGFSQQVVLGPDGTLKTSREEKEIVFPIFYHSTQNGSASFELNEESEGTQRLFGLVAPILDALKNGRALVVDELDCSLHTLLVRRIISMFHDEQLNKNGAQIIFTTHDTSLLDHMLFRRDQVWFTEKDRDQATCLFPLTDFSPRKQEAWEKGYLKGRYGAVPFLGDMPNFYSLESDYQPIEHNK